MAQQLISVGTLPNDLTGDPLRTAFTKINDNFTELFSRPTYVEPLVIDGVMITTDSGDIVFTIKG